MDGAFAPTVTILGETWTITLGTRKSHPNLKKADGYCDSSTREIVIKKQREEAKPREQQNLLGDERRTGGLDRAAACQAAPCLCGRGRV